MLCNIIVWWTVACLGIALSINWVRKRQEVIISVYRALRVTPYGVYTELYEVVFCHLMFFLKGFGTDRSRQEKKVEAQFRDILDLPPDSATGSNVLISFSCRTIFYCVIQSLIEESRKKNNGHGRIRICTISVHFGSFYRLLQSMQEQGDDSIELYEVDLNQEDWTLNESSIDREQVRKCDLILCQNLFGVPFEQEPLFQLGKAFGIPVLEDCVQSGSMYGRYKGHELADVIVWSGGIDKTPSCLGAGFGFFRETKHGSLLYKGCYEMHRNFKVDSYKDRLASIVKQSVHLMIAKNTFLIHYIAAISISVLMEGKNLKMHEIILSIRREKAVAPFQHSIDKFCRQTSVYQLLSIQYGLSKGSYTSTAQKEAARMTLLLDNIPSCYHSTLFPWLTPKMLQSYRENQGISEFVWVAAPEVGERAMLAEFLSKHSLLILINTTWEYHKGSNLKVGQRICDRLVYLPHLNQLQPQEVMRVAHVLTKWCERETRRKEP